MTYTQRKPHTFAELLDYDDGSDYRYELLSTGELVQSLPESEENNYLAMELYEALKAIVARRLIKTHLTTIQVQPVGDDKLNRYTDLIVLQPEHIDLMAISKKNAIAFGMPSPKLVAEFVSPGGEKSENYRRDYEWKRQQYQLWGIPEYWIVDSQRAKVTVLTLAEGGYQEAIYSETDLINSNVFPQLTLAAVKILKA